MLKVSDLMTREVFSLQDLDTLLDAKSVMSLAKIRHIPITGNSGAFVGILTHRDILSSTVSKLAEIDQSVQDELDAGIPIREIMRTDVTTVTPEMDLKEAAKILLDHKYGCLPVVDDGQLTGIITEADFLALTISLMEAFEDQADSVYKNFI